MQVLGDWLLTPERVAVHLPTATAVAADLHLGYAQARLRRGEAVPVRPLSDLLASLARVGARRLIIAGDLFEEGRFAAELAEEFRSYLNISSLKLVGIVPGNHDRGLSGDWPLCPAGFALGEWQIVHGDGKLPAGPVVFGHVHPCLRWGGQTAPCFLVSPRRLVLPAFSTDAAGVNVLGDARWRAYQCCAVVGDRVLDFGVLGEMRRQLRGKQKGRHGR